MHTTQEKTFIMFEISIHLYINDDANNSYLTYVIYYSCVLLKLLLIYYLET